MLNYIWVSLIIIAVVVAVGSDLHDQSVNKYRNGTPMEITVRFDKSFVKQPGSSQDGVLSISFTEFQRFYGLPVGGKETISQPIKVTFDQNGKGAFLVALNDHAPLPWKEIAKASNLKDKLAGTIVSLSRSPDEKTITCKILFEPVTFVHLKQVTQSALEYAVTAVNIAIGLIGIMALWLGVMKVAEAAGAIVLLTKAFQPFAKVLFPEIPQGHPVLGSMMMNISANMLGLSNAATPLGLKAMEELEKLNKKKELRRILCVRSWQSILPG